MKPSPYYDPSAISREASAGRHREAIGGLWDELGQLQMDFLLAQGMVPEQRLLDIGCGALRLGVKAVDYLLPGHYYGMDISRELLDAGYDRELTPAQRQRLPRGQLQANGEFDFSFVGEPVELAIAQSVFTHLPMNHIRRCLDRLAPWLAEGGVLFATAFIIPEESRCAQDHAWEGASGEPPIITHDTADPYHYYFSDFRHLAGRGRYQVSLIGDWGHPRGQSMLAFRRSAGVLA